MRGISTVIVVVLILMITVTLASAAYIWFKSLFGVATMAGGAEAERLTETGKSLMKIETISKDKIYLRNIGETNLSGFAVYLNDIPVDYTSDKEILAKGELAEIEFVPTKYEEENEIKITTSQGVQDEKKFKFLKKQWELVTHMTSLEDVENEWEEHRVEPASYGISEPLQIMTIDIEEGDPFFGLKKQFLRLHRQHLKLN